MLNKEKKGSLATITSSIRFVQRVDKIEQKLYEVCEEGIELINAFEEKILGNLNP